MRRTVYPILTARRPAADDPEPVIVDVARRLEANAIPARQLGIQFVQIGDDPEATAALKELDDGLEQKHGIQVCRVHDALALDYG